MFFNLNGVSNLDGREVPILFQCFIFVQVE
jgi:hypothetical protein